MSAELMIFAWSLALVAAVAAGLLLLGIEWLSRGGRGVARDPRADADRSDARPAQARTLRPVRPLGSLVRGWVTSLR